jgi:adenylosuccinate synthase
LDIPLLQFSNCLNGFTSLNITKLDVMTGLNPIKIGVAYKDSRTGKVLPEGYFPDHLDDLANIEVVYEDMEGWTEDIAKARSEDN